MVRFVCSECGKVFEDMKQYGEHIVAEAKKAEKAKEAARVAESEAKLEALETNIKAIYRNLKKSVDKYNKIAEDLGKTRKVNTTLAFDEVEDDDLIKVYNKETGERVTFEEFLNDMDEFFKTLSEAEKSEPKAKPHQCTCGRDIPQPEDCEPTDEEIEAFLKDLFGVK